MVHTTEMTASLYWSADVSSPTAGLPNALATMCGGTCQATAVKKLSKLLGEGGESASKVSEGHGRILLDSKPRPGEEDTAVL